MSNQNQPFDNTTLVIPGAYYGDSVADALPDTAPATPPLIFLGYGYGQQPFVPVTYNLASLLLAAIRGGPAADFVPFLTNPSLELNGAQKITFIQVGQNTQSALLLSAAGSGAITLTSTNYGLPSNLLQGMVQSGTTAGRRLTLYDGYGLTTVVGDNLGVPFTISYLGSTSGVTFSVVVSGGVATKLTTTSSGPAGESLSIPLGPGNFSTTAQVVAYLNGTGYYSAALLSSSNGQLPSASLDLASGVALASGGVSVNVTANLTDVVYWTNQFAQNYATAALVSGVTSASGVALTTMVSTVFSGATSVPPTLGNYASGFNVALTQPGWTVFADSGSSGVIALGAQHAYTASTPAVGRWRRFFSGSALGDSVAQGLTKALSMGTISSCFAYPGHYRTSTVTGINTLYDGLHSAACAAGMATGNPPATPLTNTAIIGNGVEIQLSTGQIDQLQQGGVMPLWESPQTGQPTIISDFTTWLTDGNPENVFTQQVACRYYTAYAVVAAMQPYAGSIASPVSELTVRRAIIALFNALTYSPNKTNGVIATWDPTSLVLTYSGTQQLLGITVNITFVGQNRFITTFVNVEPLNIVIAGATAAAVIQ